MKSDPRLRKIRENARDLDEMLGHEYTTWTFRRNNLSISQRVKGVHAAVVDAYPLELHINLPAALLNDKTLAKEGTDIAALFRNYFLDAGFGAVREVKPAKKDEKLTFILLDQGDVDFHTAIERLTRLLKNHIDRVFGPDLLKARRAYREQLARGEIEKLATQVEDVFSGLSTEQTVLLVQELLERSPALRTGL